MVAAVQSYIRKGFFIPARHVQTMLCYLLTVCTWIKYLWVC